MEPRKAAGPQHDLKLKLKEKGRNDYIKKGAARALRNEVVVINGNQVTAGFVDVGSEFSSILCSAL